MSTPTWRRCMSPGGWKSWRQGRVSTGAFVRLWPLAPYYTRLVFHYHYSCHLFFCSFVGTYLKIELTNLTNNLRVWKISLLIGRLGLQRSYIGTGRWKSNFCAQTRHVGRPGDKRNAHPIQLDGGRRRRQNRSVQQVSIPPSQFQRPLVKVPL